MAIVVVGGAAKDIGKTALTCAIIAALPEFAWTAVKITGHDYESVSGDAANRTVWKETRARQETDTGRYLMAGARRAFLVTRVGAEVPIGEIRKALGGDRDVIFESNRIVDAVRPDVCLALIGSESPETKASFTRLLTAADAVVTLGESPLGALPDKLPRFRLESAGKLSPEMISWLRKRLNAPPQRAR